MGVSFTFRDRSHLKSEENPIVEIEQDG